MARNRNSLRGFNNNLYRELVGTSHEMLVDGALTFAAALQKATSRGPRSGRYNREYGVRSSTPDQYSQFLSGEYNRGIDVRETPNPLVVQWGVYGVDQRKLNTIEYGDPSRGIIGRRNIQRISVEALAAANAAMDRSK